MILLIHQKNRLMEVIQEISVSVHILQIFLGFQWASGDTGKKKQQNMKRWRRKPLQWYNRSTWNGGVARWVKGCQLGIGIGHSEAEWLWAWPRYDQKRGEQRGYGRKWGHESVPLVSFTGGICSEYKIALKIAHWRKNGKLIDNTLLWLIWALGTWRTSLTNPISPIWRGKRVFWSFSHLVDKKGGLENPREQACRGDKRTTTFGLPSVFWGGWGCYLTTWMISAGNNGKSNASCTTPGSTIFWINKAVTDWIREAWTVRSAMVRKWAVREFISSVPVISGHSIA